MKQYFYLTLLKSKTSTNTIRKMFQKIFSKFFGGKIKIFLKGRYKK